LARLADSGRLHWAEQEFVALLDFKPRVHPEPWRRTSGMNKVRDPRKAAIVRAMWQAREELAQRADRSPGRLLPDAAIIAAAQAEPQNLKALSEMPEFARHRRRLVLWWTAIANAKELTDDELPVRPAPVVPPPRRSWERKNPDAAKRLAAVRAFVVGRAEELNIPAEVLIAPDLIRKLAWDPPATIDESEIAAVLTATGARGWQVDQLTLGLVAGLMPASEAETDADPASVAGSARGNADSDAATAR
jgi:ribonuclease D